MASVTFYDAAAEAIDSTNELEVETLDASLTITAKADTGYVAPSVTVVSSNPAVLLSTNGTTWVSSIILTNVDDTGVDFYVKQTAKLLYGIDAYLAATYDENMTFIPEDYTFASTYFVNADITALVA